jgi:hypothetical protein
VSRLCAAGEKFVFYWIYDHSSLVVGIAFAFVFALAMCLAILLVRPRLRVWFHRGKLSNEMVGFVFSSFFVLYGLLLGLLSVAAYQNYSDVDALVTAESSSLAALYRDMRGYPKAMRNGLHAELSDYTQYVIRKSWPCQQQGIITNEEAHRLTQLMDHMMSFRPEDRAQEIIHAEALRQVNLLAEIQSSRANSVATGIPGEMWWVVVLGALISIFMLALFDMEIHVHLILSSALAAFLGVVIFVIAMMDNPFRGELSIGPDAFQEVYDSLIKPNDDVVKAMATLTGGAQNLGKPGLEGVHPVAGRTLPGLYFGDSLVNNDFEIVDAVVRQHGGTATLFAKDGEDFVRVSTNVMKEDGERALGTVLDPRGAVMMSIKNGSAYYGAATILGKKYFTAYEPIYASPENIIGVYYVGFELAEVVKTTSNREGYECY